MKKKTVLIIVGVLVGLLLLCVACGGGGVLLFSSIMKEGFEVRESRIYDMCEASKNFSQSDYEDYFSTDYRSRNTFNDAKKVVTDFFPSDYNCEDLKDKSLIMLLSSGESLSVNTGDDKTTIEFSKNGLTMTFEEEEGEYKIVSTTEVK